MMSRKRILASASRMLPTLAMIAAAAVMALAATPLLNPDRVPGETVLQSDTAAPGSGFARLEIPENGLALPRRAPTR